MPTFVDNDATVAALAEAHDEGAELATRCLVMITVGTGIGGGIVIDGRAFRGATGAAGEIGHTLVAIDETVPPPTRFPQPGSLEAIAAGHVLDGLAAAAAADHPRLRARPPARRARQRRRPRRRRRRPDGDAVAIGCVATLGRRVGIGVANLINTFDPEVVAIGGGVSSAGRPAAGPGQGGGARVRAAGRGHTD